MNRLANSTNLRQNEDLLLKYAQKALTFHFQNRDKKQRTFPTPLQQQIQIDKRQPSFFLTGANPATDREVREKHCYQDTPNINLARALFELCGSCTKAGNACIEYCAELASKMNEHEVISNASFPTILGICASRKKTHISLKLQREWT